MNKHNLYLIIIFIIALFLRLYNFGDYSLSFDQVQILENAEKIKSGDFTLIGPRTGPADMFTGPLIYYICTLLMFFIPSPWTIIATSIFISIFTGLILLLLLKKYLGPKQSIIYFSIWALSPFIISLDRTVWNPNLTLISSLLIFLPLTKIISKQKINLKDILFICLGIFLTYQAHFSGFLLIVIIFFAFLFFFPKNKKSFILILGSGFSLALSLLPTIIFDFKNNFINFNGLLKFNQEKIDPDKTVLLRRFFHNILITLENFGKTFFLNNSYQLILFCGLLIISSFFFINKEKTKSKLFLLSYFLIIIVTFTFYRDSLPEYYFIIQFPVIIYIISHLISKLKNINYFIIVFCLYSIFINISNYSHQNSHSISNLLDINKKLNDINNAQGIKKLIIDAKLQDRFGIDYLLKNQNYNNTDGEVIHLAYPISPIKYYDYILSGWGIWLDHRLEDFNYIEKNEYIIKTIPNIKLYQNQYVNQVYNSEETYDIREDDKKIGNLVIYSRTKNPQKFKYYYDRVSDLSEEKYIKNKNITKLQNQYIISYYKQNNFVAVIIPEKEFAQTSFINNINFLNISNEI